MDLSGDRRNKEKEDHNKERCKKEKSMHAYLGQHLIFNSARRDSGGLLSMVILRFELESEAMEELEGVDEENKYYIKNKVDPKNTEKN